jgi:hypothetical protein
MSSGRDTVDGKRTTPNSARRKQRKPLDLRLFAEIAPQKVRFGMKPLQIPADRDRLGEV